MSKIEVSFPYELYNSITKFPVNHVFPCSVLFNENLIGGVFLICSSDDIDYFKINISEIPQPNINFRMLNIDKKTYLIEIDLLFKLNRILKFQLNPICPNVVELFNLLIENKQISFHFYNKQANLIASSFTSLDDDEIVWFKRNNKLMSTFDSKMDYMPISHYLAEKMKKNEKVYKYYDNNSFDHFIRTNQKIITIR